MTTSRVEELPGLSGGRRGWAVWANKPSAAIASVSAKTKIEASDLVVKPTGLTQGSRIRFAVREKAGK